MSNNGSFDGFLGLFVPTLGLHTLGGSSWVEGLGVFRVVEQGLQGCNVWTSRTLDLFFLFVRAVSFDLLISLNPKPIGLRPWQA